MVVTTTILTALLGVAKIAGGITVARAVGKGLNAIGERIIPYEKTRAYKQVEHSAKRQKDLELMRESFQARLQKENIKSQGQLAVFNRQSSMILAEKNAYTSLRHTLIQDAIKNFPLNISPLVLLENNGIDINFLLGKTQFSEIEEKQFDNLIEGNGGAKPLNVFITPMHVDARVAGKESIVAQIYDSMYSSLESVFVNEYNRNSNRPVILYSTAWNKNVKAGSHAADELYYFLKEMPTIVVEPKFDGKNIKFMFSYWGIGYDSTVHIRQEIQIPMDMNSLIAISVYTRSKKALESIKNVTPDIKILKEQRVMYEHNISVFEQLNLSERIETRLAEISKTGQSAELDELGDYCKLLYINQSDLLIISDTISAVAGMIISALADTHHLLANDIKPRFPYIYKQYFEGFVNGALLETFGEMYERTYLRLSQEFPEQEYRRLIEKEAVMKYLGIKSSKKDTNPAVIDALILKCVSLKADRSKICNWSESELLDYYIDNIDDDVQFRKSVLPFMTTEQKKRLNNKLIN